MNCFCGSNLKYDDCCKHFNELVYLQNNNKKSNERFDEPLLIEWMTKTGNISTNNYISKIYKYLYLLGEYINQVFDLYLYFDLEKPHDDKHNEIYIALKNNVLQSIFAATSCLSQGLFIQAGVLLRAAQEDCFVILDMALNKDQYLLFRKDKYRANKSLSRIKNILPIELIHWYGFFSSNYTHAGPLHKVGVTPRACHPDNWLLLIGFQNVVWVIVSFHIICERIYFNQIEHKCFWIRDKSLNEFSFLDDNKIFEWMKKMGAELEKKYPQGEQKDGFIYSDESVTLKI